MIRLSFALGGTDIFWDCQNQRNFEHFWNSVWTCFMSTYFNGVRPIFLNWISVVQHIFSSGTSALLNLQMCCCWIKFPVPFPSSAQCPACVYLHFSWPVCSASHRNPAPQWAHLTHPTPWPSWQDQLTSFSFRAVFYNVIRSDWDQQRFSQKPLKKNELLN